MNADHFNNNLTVRDVSLVRALDRRLADAELSGNAGEFRETFDELVTLFLAAGNDTERRTMTFWLEEGLRNTTSTSADTVRLLELVRTTYANRLFALAAPLAG